MQSSILPHFDLEESALYTQAKGLNEETDQLLERMIQEHVQLRDLFDQIAHIDETVLLTKLMDETGEMLEKHIRFEERLLFTSVQDTISEEKMLIIKELIHPGT